MIKIIYEDQDLLIIDKPSHLVVDPADSVKEETLADILQKDFGIKLFRGGIVHRLDKDTSGIILVAKSQEALENLQAQFKSRKIKKEYLALVHGFLEKEGVVDASIIRNPINREKFTVLAQSTSKESKPTFEVSAPSGREAITEYEPIEQLKVQNEKLKVWFGDFNKIQMRKLEKMNYNQFTLIVCRPLTGRTHQIRVHLKYIGYPIVADPTYTGRKMLRLDNRWCPRIFLHARKIGFFHPGSKEWMELECELPEDLSKVLGSLRSLEQ